jgi:predicted nucleic-acid-binding Zn-ribbon protein
MKRKSELERTCKRCSTVWYARKETKPNRWEIAGAKMSGRRAASYQTQAQMLEQKRDRIEAAEQCPQCGSSAYDEREVPLA